MASIFWAQLLCLLLCCAAYTSGVQIQSDPGVSGGGVIQTELNRTVSLLCLSDGAGGGGGGGEEEEELVWLRNGAFVSLQGENKKGRSRVCVTPVIDEDNGANFTCHLYSNTSVSASVTLNVTYHPPLSGSEDLEAEEESVFVMQCDIRANPQVTSVVWTLNGSAVDLLASALTLTNDGSMSQLVANSVNRSLHQGTYQCATYSAVYGEHRKGFVVTVTDKVLRFPLMPMIAGIVVVCLTALLAVASRWHRITKCCK